MSAKTKIVKIRESSNGITAWEGDLRKEVSMNIKRWWIPEHFVGCGIAKGCLSADSGRRQMRAPAKVVALASAAKPQKFAGSRGIRVRTIRRHALRFFFMRV